MDEMKKEQAPTAAQKEVAIEPAAGSEPTWEDLVQMDPPPGLPAEEVDRLVAEADAVAGRLTADPDDRSLMRETFAPGDRLQDQANQDFKLLRTSMGKIMDRLKESGQSTSIPSDLKHLREVMDEINPYPAIEQMKRSQTAGFFSRLFRGVPGVGKILSDIAQRYESVQTQIEAVIQSLDAGSDKLLENSIEIEQRYDSLKALQEQVKLEAYKLKVVAEKLEEAKSRATDPHQRRRLQKAQVRVVRRLQNLHVTTQAFSQFFITMNTTLDNHENLRDAIRSMTGLTRPVLENGLALKIAQQEEKQIAQALAQTQDYLGNLMVSVAQDSMDNAAYVAEVTNQPLVKFQDLVKSYNILVDRMDEANKIENQMMETARKNIDQLERMTSDLERRAKDQEEARETVESL